MATLKNKKHTWLKLCARAGGLAGGFEPPGAGGGGGFAMGCCALLWGFEFDGGGGGGGALGFGPFCDTGAGAEGFRAPLMEGLALGVSEGVEFWINLKKKIVKEVTQVENSSECEIQ